jgi:hypothetical protein
MTEPTTTDDEHKCVVAGCSAIARHWDLGQGRHGWLCDEHARTYDHALEFVGTKPTTTDGKFNLIDEMRKWYAAKEEAKMVIDSGIDLSALELVLRNHTSETFVWRVETIRGIIERLRTAEVGAKQRVYEYHRLVMLLGGTPHSNHKKIVEHAEQMAAELVVKVAAAEQQRDEAGKAALGGQQLVDQLREQLATAKAERDAAQEDVRESGAAIGELVEQVRSLTATNEQLLATREA